MTSDRVERIVVEPAAAEAVDRPGHRRLLVLGALTALLLLGALVLFLVDRHRQIERAEQLQASVTALAQQVTNMGGTPVVQPPGLPGPAGPPGRDGRDGADGRDGRDGKTPACLSEPPQCRGADGAPGETGTPGQDGKDGKDGQDGAPGKDGADGRPPTGWTWVDDAGRTQSCTRDPGSPDSAPTYSCTARSDGPPGTTTSAPDPVPLLPP